jgi:hypothetical protein
LAKTPADLDPGDPGQHPVQDDQVRQLLLSLDQRLLTIRGERYCVALPLEVVPEQGPEGVVVLDHKDAGVHGQLLGSEII